jgi:hypothetical protein
VIRLSHFFCIIHAAYATVISGPAQTETYQIPGGGPTHGTDGPLNVALAVEGTLGDFDEQFLQVARALDPARARAPPDTDTNDLSTINVYTVGVLLLSYESYHLCLLASYQCVFMFVESIALAQRWPKFVHKSP